MKRRKFFAASAIVASASMSSELLGTDLANEEKNNELVELRTYELTFGGNRNALMLYLNDVLHPALTTIGVNNFMIYKELGDAEPTKIWTVATFPSLDIYHKSLTLPSTESFINKAKSYAASGKSYNRISSSLLFSFDGWPQLVIPSNDSKLFELRIYEGENEDAVRRKIKMFNVEEITLFKKVGFKPVFFGDMVVGSIMPCLVYMLAFKSMKERDDGWNKFVAHPDWNEMKVKPEYANTLSNIRKIFLESI